MRSYLAVLIVLTFFGVPAVSTHFGKQVDEIAAIFASATDQFAAVILAHNPRSVAEIQSHYSGSGGPGLFTQTTQSKVKILVVPGHEPGYGGAEYGSLKERDMTLELAQDLMGYLNADSHYQAFTDRDASGWTPVFSSYFADHHDDIASWMQASKKEMSQLVSLGQKTLPPPTVYHATAPTNVAMRLYGITKWANENDIDITIHIHFNDYPGHGREEGKYSGFVVYAPVDQYNNSTTTHAIADAIYKRLSDYNPVSTLPGESAGIVDDPELIAVGANNTADAASMLIEYAYIYEPQLADPETRSLALKDMAYQTYLGLENFFDPHRAGALAKAYDTVTLPYAWKNPITAVGTRGPDVFALQTALAIDGEYPPSDKTKNDCPRTGKVGACTRQAVQEFQNKNGIEGEEGVGVKTLELLNREYGAQISN